MFLTILTLLSALSISAVAIFYSIAGLAAIFAGAAVPIMIMGSVLEVGKLVTASWLYQHWKQAPRFLKYYLTIAVLILMFITSMGIFGYLSKAHVEQTAPTTLISSKIVQLDDQIVRENGKIERWNTELGRLNSGTSVRIDNLVDSEQQKLDKIFNRIDKEIADITLIANQNIETQKERIDQAKERADRDIKQIQDRMKGAFSKSRFDKEIDQIRKNEVAVAASAQREIIAIQNKLNEDIQKIKDKYAGQIESLTTKITEFTSEASEKTGDIEAKIKELEIKIQSSYKLVDGYNEEKYDLKGQIKEIEVEVGPIKYIAEFVYGVDANENMLEEAVRWVIIIIIFVFDPLAVLLLIAANYNLKQRYGKSIEDFADKGFTKDDSGVEPDEYWKERYEDMQDQLERFNHLKDQEDTGDIKEDKRNNDADMLAAGYSLDEIQKKKFEQREKDEQKALEEYAEKARQEIIEEVYPNPDIKDGFDPDEVEGYEEFNKKPSTVKESKLPETKVEEVEIKDLSDQDVKKKT
tara:strand:- start:23 stop:1591 length:1569 start_codon:yes stop_codon:yes gene_type:complete